MESLSAIEKAIDYIEENLKNNISVEQVASAVGYSEYHFLRIFKRLVGLTPADYIRKRRISQIVECMEQEDGRRPISDIAFEYGFNSKENFTRAFKAEHHILPTEYRRCGNSLKLYARFEFGPAYRELDCDIVELDSYRKLGCGIVEPDSCRKLGCGVVEPDACRKLGCGIVEPDACRKLGCGIVEPGSCRKLECDIVELDPFCVVAYPSDEEDPTKFWNKYNVKGLSKRLSGGRTVLDYGVCRWNAATLRLDYWIGVAEADALGNVDGTDTLSLSGGLYAVFKTPAATHTDFVRTIRKTWDYIRDVWLPRSRYERRHSYEFECYVEECQLFSETIYIPIKIKAE